MPNNSRNLPSGTEKKKKNERGVRCIYRAFLRFCGDRDAVFVLSEAGVGGSTKASRQSYLRKLRQGKPVEQKVFTALATVLRCEPSNLFFTPEPRLPRWDSPSYKFALRVAKLIETGAIPLVDPDTNEPTDVVRFVWEMGDQELDRMRLTYKEQRDGFIFLRDYLMMVVERPIETKRRYAKHLGVMEIDTPPADDVIADVRVRHAASVSAFDTLEAEWDDDKPFHINRIRSLVKHRLNLYRDADVLDQTQWELETEHDPELTEEDWKLRNEPQVNMDLVRNVVDADFHLRKVIFPTYQQDEAFSSYYSRSRQLIEWVQLKFPEKFPTWWNRFKAENTEELRRFVSAWDCEDYDDPPQWEAMKKALKGNLQRTIDQIWEHYPGTLVQQTKKSK